MKLSKAQRRKIYLEAAIKLQELGREWHGLCPLLCDRFSHIDRQWLLENVFKEALLFKPDNLTIGDVWWKGDRKFISMAYCRTPNRFIING